MVFYHLYVANWKYICIYILGIDYPRNDTKYRKSNGGTWMAGGQEKEGDCAPFYLLYPGNLYNIVIKLYKYTKIANIIWR